jgi:hypothetical protein
MKRILVWIVALIMWSAFSYALVSMFAGSNVCTILQPVGPDMHRLTQAEMDASVAARCNRPNFGTLAVAGAGYLLILGVGASLSFGDRKRDA